jgi:hypothetical protein
MGNPFLRNLGPAGVVSPLFTDEADEDDTNSDVIVLPLIIARAE